MPTIVVRMVQLSRVLIACLGLYITYCLVQLLRCDGSFCLYHCSAIGHTSNLLLFNFGSFKIARAISASVKDEAITLLTSRAPYQQRQQGGGWTQGSYHAKMRAGKLPGPRPMRYVGMNGSLLSTYAYVELGGGGGGGGSGGRRYNMQWCGAFKVPMH